MNKEQVLDVIDELENEIAELKIDLENHKTSIYSKIHKKTNLN